MKKLSDMVCVSIILARGGSKGIKNKNLIEVGGKPLLYWSIMHSKQCKEIKEVYVSSDSKEILNCASYYGAKPIIRPAKISSDTSSSEDGWIHALKYIELNFSIKPDLVIAPQVTSPIRAKDDFSKAIKKFVNNNYDSLLSVVGMKDFFIWEEINDELVSINYDYKNRKRRQLIKEKFHENGSFYIFSPNIIKKNKNRLGGKIGYYRMEKIQELQIDEKEDILLCDNILKYMKY